MKKGKVISVSVNPDTLIEGAQIMFNDNLFGVPNIRIGKVKLINKELQKIVFEETFYGGNAMKGVLISDLKTIIIKHESDNVKFQTPLKYSDWKNVIDNKLLDTDVYFKFEIIYPKWNDLNAIDIAFIVDAKDDDVYIGRLGNALDFIQEHPEAIYDLIKASGKTFNEIKNDE